MKVVKYFTTAALVVVPLGLALSAMAGDEVVVTDVASETLGIPVSDADLAANRGGSALQISGMDLDSNLLDNQALANITGNNFVTEGALTSASGFSTVVQNSGNNVIIQNATIVNLSVH